MLVTSAIAVGTPVSNTGGSARDIALRKVIQATSVLTVPTIESPADDRHDGPGGGLERLTAALLARRSVRTFSRTPPVNASTVQELLQIARDADARCRNRGALPFTIATYALLNGRFTDAPSGLYSLSADGDLIRLVDLGADEIEERYVNQRALGLAPIKLVTAADVPGIVARFGAAAYREALVRAGDIVGSVWIGALELGLAGVPGGGFLESACVELLSRGEQPYSSTLLGFCCGYAAPGTPDQ
jgi:nitroreductase